MGLLITLATSECGACLCMAVLSTLSRFSTEYRLRTGGQRRPSSNLVIWVGSIIQAGPSTTCYMNVWFYNIHNESCLYCDVYGGTRH
jgi:hypothetical protein